jgi:CRISPR-associated protein Csm3
MFGKIQITGELEVITGMHIGGSAQFAAIGAVDSPVVRDRRSDMPMIPGSSLKGKLRTLLAKRYSDKKMLGNHEEDPEIVLRLFGSSEKGAVKGSRLIFTDMIISNMEELKKEGLHSATEIKFENSINRLTAVANPRQIERTIRGSKFKFEIIYNVDEEKEILEDFEAIKEGMILLQYDYLGGHGSRGYGRVEFHSIEAKAVIGDIDEGIISKCNNILKDV